MWINDISYFKTPYGELLLGSYKIKLSLCNWRYRKIRDSIDNWILKILNDVYIEKDIKLFPEVRKQLNEYF